MPQFILAFPMNVGVADNIVINENVSIAADAKSVMIPGCGVMFNVVRKDAVPQLLDIFKEHQDISAEAAAAIEQHKSLLFLLGEAKSIEDVTQVNMAILKLFSAGAQGVYMQQSGAAWSVDGFRDELGDGEYPMDPWINFVEHGDLIYTLGLACFALPDLSISSSIEEAQEALLLAADSLFGDGIPAKSGSEVDLGDDEVYVLRSETKIPFPKDSPEFNKGGILRLNKKK
ncbi:MULTISPECIES: hypothetical protein [unclassified Fibrobacter]|uniref:hypothetical protein n=1 Tax=unclassified Fibrobacter TaxID=2634177 RepID=UPI000D6B2C4E|nr:MULTISPECIES: hypothetical protein [unclassified Fibrobacter]PWJ71924.1 hypothetical protein BGX12_101163 [Fibrobacter sp. UWR4]PZW70374.1 hypothetical protein C8E88_101231 [Fibrobacter sp. UWR1]